MSDVSHSSSISNKILTFIGGAIVSAFVFLIAGPYGETVFAEVFTVTKTEDTNDAICDEDCSLREAIEIANTTAGFDEIRFALPQSDPGYINPDGSRSSSGEPPETYTAQEHGYYILPITSDLELKSADGVFINGYSQENAYRNTAVFGRPINAHLMIQLVFENESNLLLYETNNNHLSGLNIQQGTTLIGYGSERNWIEGNFIGTTIDGMSSVPTGNIHLDKGATYNLIGTNGDEEGDEGERNIISGVTEIGIRIGFIDELYDDTDYQPTVGNKVAGNYIGTDRTGEQCIANFIRSAVVIEGGDQNRETRIGSDLDGRADEEEGNIIGCVSNTHAEQVGGTVLFNTTESQIASNYIGISPGGKELLVEQAKETPHLLGFISSPDDEPRLLPNSNNLITRNVIGYGSSHNMIIQGEANRIEENTIRDSALSGIVIASASIPINDQIQISSWNEVRGNWIFQNAGPGVFEFAPYVRNTRITENVIFQNDGLGIDIGDQFSLKGATSSATILPNDPGDEDRTESGNQLMNYPVLKKIGKTADNYLIVLMDGPFNSEEMPFRIELFDNGRGEGIETRQGKYYIGSALFDQQGADMVIPVPVVDYEPMQAEFITATVRNRNGSTSEFSDVPQDKRLYGLPALFEIQGGETRVSSRDVTLTIGDLSPIVNVTEMRVSNSESFDGAAWQPYQPSISWTLSEGDGVKTVYLSLRTDTGYELPVITDRVGVNVSLSPTQTPSRSVPPGVVLDGSSGATGTGGGINTNIQVAPGALGFLIPDFSDILTFFIRFIFVIVGIAALIYALWGAFSWVTSGGEQENLDKARQKIVAAFVGIILVVVVLATIIAFEQFVFQERICFGLSCPVQIPPLLEGCVPNPQYRQTPPPDREGQQPWVYPVGADNRTECCPPGPSGEDIRITTGWLPGTRTFGEDEYKVCCLYGDADGDQVCDIPVQVQSN